MAHIPLKETAFVSFFLSLVLTGCSQDFASFDDVHVPATAEERFPISVREMPVKLTVAAGKGGQISKESTDQIIQYAHNARSKSAFPIYVSYPSRSASAKATAQEAVRILLRSGIQGSEVHVSAYDGKSDVVSLSYHSKVAITAKCGDWSRNIANDGRNEAYPNFGCTAQNNLAAMVANPEDFEKPRTMTNASAAGRMSAMKNYESGEWSQQPVALPSAAGSSGSE